MAPASSHIGHLRDDGPSASAAPAARGWLALATSSSSVTRGGEVRMKVSRLGGPRRRGGGGGQQVKWELARQKGEKGRQKGNREFDMRKEEARQPVVGKV